MKRRGMAHYPGQEPRFHAAQSDKRLKSGKPTLRKDERGIVMYGRPRCCKGETDLKRRVSLQSCIRPFRCGTLTAGPDGIRKIDAQ